MLTCGVWVKKGIAKEEPDRVQLSEDDIKQLLEDTKERIQDVDGVDAEELDALEETLRAQAVNAEDEDDEDDEGEEDENGVKEENKKKNKEELDSDEEIRAEYGLDGYDEEGAVMTGAGMAGLMYFSSNKEDPYVDLKDLDDDDRDDYLIRKDDNLFVVGKMDEEFSCLEIYVYNENEDSLYVHHDILLESFPLCLEWLSYDPSLDGKSGNLVAVGTMEPDIQIWDLDIVDTVEPAFVLHGSKKKKKKKKSTSSGNGHTDAILGLSWNCNVKNVMASASADNTVKLWDMSKCVCVHTLTHHTDKVQAVKWHPYEAQSLLTGAFDRKAAVLDCRSPDVFKSWSLGGECEQVLWDHFSPFNFFVSTDDGTVYYFDVRSDQPVFTLHAHDLAVTGIALGSQMAGCLTTVSSDKILKVWDYQNHKPKIVLSRDMKMGNINFIASCPDIPMGYALGGEKDGVRTLNIMETSQGKEHFQNRQLQHTVETTEEESKDKNRQQKGEHMDTDNAAADSLALLSLKTDTNLEENNVEIIKRKKKKKKKK